jgi:NADH-quinone oxidoreductase subunit N
MPLTVPALSFTEWIPFAVVLLSALAVILVEAFAPERRRVLAWISGLGLVVAGWSFWVGTLPEGRSFFLGMLMGDRLAGLGALLILFSSLMTVLLSSPSLKARSVNPGEYFALLLFAVFGILFLAFAQEILTIFICIEILSLSLYVLTGIDRRDPRALEAGFKYFILGSLASAFFIFGAAFLFGATASTRLDVIADRLALGMRPGIAGPEHISPMWVYVGAVLMIGGFSFKLSVAPFHMWAPDVYQGAPTPVTILIATASKVGGFIAFVRVIEALWNWPLFEQTLGPLLWALAAVSILWGNIAALMQRDLKRMLAYSSVAHGGYLMVAIAAYAHIQEASQFAAIRNAVIVYLLAYALMKIVAFGVVAALGPGAEIPMRNWRGIARRRPGVAAALALSMISLTGIPPTVGFIGKFYVFQLAVEVGLIPLAILAVLASVVSAFYYLRLVVTMYMEEPEPEVPGGLLAALPHGGAFALGLSTALVFLFGIAPIIFLVL